MMRALSLAAALMALSALPAAAESPVKVSADTFVVDQAKFEATFSGNVVVSRSDLTVWADRVVVEYGEGGIENI